MRPIRQLFCIALENLSVNHTEEQTRLLIIYGIVIDISPIGNQTHTATVEDGLIVAGNNLSDRNVVTTFHYTTGDARGVDGGMIGGNEEYADEETCLVGTTDVIKFVVCREYRFKYQAFTFSETFLAELFTVLYRLHNGLLGVPVAKLVLGNLVWVDIDGILHPLMLQNLCSNSRLARTVWPCNDNKDWFVKSGYHVARIFCASCRICSKKRFVASSLVRLASSAASFISCERTASEGSSMLVNRYVSIVGFITIMFTISSAKVQK